MNFLNEAEEEKKRKSEEIKTVPPIYNKRKDLQGKDRHS